jgi:D-lyxose ketol-isomerase
MKRELYNEVKSKTAAMLDAANIALTPAERESIEVADFGLGDVYKTGLQLVTYVNTERCCAKELVLFPWQTCPEHRHDPFGDYIGKEETFRCRKGTVYLYVSGEATPNPACKPPQGDEAYYTAAHEIILNPGEQFTLVPGTRHWFVGGAEGCVVSEFSTPSFDEMDVFTDVRVKRIPEIEE